MLRSISGFSFFFAAAGLAFPPPAFCAPARRPSVVLVVLDSVRADRISPYGYKPSATPALAKLAGRASVFENAYANSNWTGPSLASILTGKLPFSHGLLGHYDHLSKDTPTIQSVLSRDGYRTAAFLTGLPGTPAYGLSRGFGHITAAEGERPMARQVSSAIEWVKKLSPEKDFFLLIHGNDAHYPYDCSADHSLKNGAFPKIDDDFYRYYDDFPAWDLRRVDPEKWKLALAYKANPTLLSSISKAYDACVTLEDADIASLIRRLGNAGGRPLMVIVTADHGELLGDHDLLGHGRFFFEQLVRVPLLISFPDGRGPARVSNIAEHVDLLPTICKASGIACPDGLDGIDLAAAEGKTPASRKWAAASGTQESLRMIVRNAAFSENGKKITFGRGKWELFDLSSDPGETRDISAEHPTEFLKTASAYLSFSGARKLLDSSPLSGETETNCGLYSFLPPKNGAGAAAACELARFEASAMARNGNFNGAEAELHRSSCTPAGVRRDIETLKMFRQITPPPNTVLRRGYILTTVPGTWNMRKGAFSVTYTAENGLECKTDKGVPAADPGCIPPAAAMLDCVENYRFTGERGEDPGHVLENALKSAGYLH